MTLSLEEDGAQDIEAGVCRFSVDKLWISRRV